MPWMKIQGIQLFILNRFGFIERFYYIIEN